jgi:hypothetical protein
MTAPIIEVPIVPPVVLRAPVVHAVATGGQSVIAMYGPLYGGFITNPYDATSQGIKLVEPLFISIVGAAASSETATTFAINPGDTFPIPMGLTGNVWVNATSSGHRFSALGVYAPAPAPIPFTGSFPPSGPTGLTAVLPSYLYAQYNDDDNLQAFVNSYNGLAQGYVDWFNSINLPIYTQPQISGPLLDWVAEGLYGITRSYLFTPGGKLVGPYNTWQLNSVAFNGNLLTQATNAALPSDDVFKRIITWHFLKGDGKVFSIRWLKRRIMRFLMGTNGTNYPVGMTPQISVLMAGNDVSIRLLSGVRTLGAQSGFNTWQLNSVPFNNIETIYTPENPLPNAAVFKEAVEDGTLELPFQFNFTVSI